MVGFKADTQIKERPICSVNNCGNPALILWGNRFVCGQCATKASVKQREIQDKMLFEGLI